MSNGAGDPEREKEREEMQKDEDRWFGERVCVFWCFCLLMFRTLTQLFSQSTLNLHCQEIATHIKSTTVACWPLHPPRSAEKPSEHGEISGQFRRGARTRCGGHCESGGRVLVDEGHSIVPCEMTEHDRRLLREGGRGRERGERARERESGERVCVRKRGKKEREKKERRREERKCARMGNSGMSARIKKKEAGLHEQTHLLTHSTDMETKMPQTHAANTEPHDTETHTDTVKTQTQGSDR